MLPLALEVPKLLGGPGACSPGNVLLGGGKLMIPFAPLYAALHIPSIFVALNFQ